MKLFDLYTRVTCTKLNILTFSLLFHLWSAAQSLSLTFVSSWCSRFSAPTIWRMHECKFAHIRASTKHIGFIGLNSAFQTHNSRSVHVDVSCGIGHFVCVITISSSSHSVVHLSVESRYGCSWWCPSHSESVRIYSKAMKNCSLSPNVWRHHSPTAPVSIPFVFHFISFHSSCSVPNWQYECNGMELRVVPIWVVTVAWRECVCRTQCEHMVQIWRTHNAVVLIVAVQCTYRLMQDTILSSIIFGKHYIVVSRCFALIFLVLLFSLHHPSHVKEKEI